MLFLFAGSGCAALIYEVVWYQLLQLAIGSTQVSLCILLATFMGGLCLGSLWISRRWAVNHPLRIYAALESGIAVCALAVLFLMPLVSRVYWAGASSGLAGMLLRGAVAALCMLLPTALMGASLPAIARWVESSERGMALWGILYGANTLGAVAGCLAAGFWLLRVYDTTVGTLAGIGINLAVAGASYLLANRSSYAAAEPGEEAVPVAAKDSPRAVYLAIAISGACALGAEVIWTRLLGMMLGATVYVFAIILAVFLAGLALGSAAVSLVMDKIRPREALGWCQLLLVFGIGWAAYMIHDSLPYWPIDTFLTRSPWYLFQLDLVRCLWAVFPPALLWGASMPLACAAVAGQSEDSGSLVGGIYAANTVGAIAGALVTTLVLVPWIGTQNSQRVIVIVAAAGGVVVLIGSRFAIYKYAAAAGLLAAALTAVSIGPLPGGLIAYGRRMPVYMPNAEIIYTAEGRNSSVAIGRYRDGNTEIDVNGHIEATTLPFDMRLQRLVGHLPALLHPNAKSVLGIGFGAGVSAGTFTRYPGIEHITICEIEPIIPPISTKYFGPQNYEVFKNPKTRVIFDDARHFLMTSRDKYDIIASDPLDVFVKGTAALYTLEYFEAVKRHLNPGGMFTLYVPLYESDIPTVKSEMATFFAAFPNSTIWANNQNGYGYDMIFMGFLEPRKIDIDEVQSKLNRPDYAPVTTSLIEVEINSAASLFAGYTGNNKDLGRWTAGATLNRDRDLKLMYMAGWGINSNIADPIYRDMLQFRQPPEIFTGSDLALFTLRRAMSFVSGRQ